MGEQKARTAPHVHSFATLSSKGQVTIPLAIREALELKQGDSLAFTTIEDGVVISRTPELLDLAGSVETPEEVRGLTFHEIRELAWRGRG